MRSIALAVVGLSVVASSAQEVPLADGLARAADYVASYRSKISGVTLEEQLLLIELSGMRMRVPQRLASDLVFIDTGSGLMTLRDLFAIDTTPTRERQPRIINLLAEPTIKGWQRAQEYARQGAHYFLADVVWWGSDPAAVFRFIEPANQPLLTYKLEGRKRVQGVQVMGIGFREKQARERKYLLGTPGNAYCSGRFWIEPATGAIHQTELWVESPTETVRSQFTYALEPSLGVLLPREGTQTYDAREPGTGMTNMGGGAIGRRLSLESSTKYTNARYTKIDLSRISR